MRVYAQAALKLARVILHNFRFFCHCRLMFSNVVDIFAY